jgi:hypothetical protein
MELHSSQKHITDLIEETLQRKVRNTIQKYANKNAQPFAENKIAGIEWNLQLTVLVDNLSLIPQPKSSLLKRFMNRLKGKKPRH